MFMFCSWKVATTRRSTHVSKQSPMPCTSRSMRRPAPFASMSRRFPQPIGVSEITPGTRHSRSPRERSDMTPEAIQHAPGQPRDAAGKKHGLAPLREFPFLAPEVIADDASSSGYVIGNCRLDSGTPGPSASLADRGGKARHGSRRTFAVRWIIMAGGATSAEWIKPKQYVPVDMQTPGLAGFHVGQTTHTLNETGQRTLARPKWFTPH